MNDKDSELLTEQYFSILEESKKQQKLIDKFVNFKKTPRDAKVGELKKLLSFYEGGRYTISPTKAGYIVNDSEGGLNVTIHIHDKTDSGTLDPRSVFYVRSLLTGREITT